MEIFVIDDGVSNLYFNCIGPLSKNMVVTDDFSIIEHINYDQFASTHGTICAGIIKTYCAEAKISSIKVMENGEAGKKSKLLIALYWCLENHVDIINLSIGSTYFLDHYEIREVCAKLLNNGCAIVAAASNDQFFSVPANLSGVFGVQCKVGTKRISFNELDLFDAPITAPSRHILRKFDGGVYITPEVNSYAASYVCAIIHKMKCTEKIIKPSIIYKTLYERYGTGNICAYSLLNCICRPVLVDPNHLFNADNLFCHWKIDEDLEPPKEGHNDEIDLVIIPYQNTEEEIIQQIKIYENQIRSIIFAGNMTNRIKKVVNRLQCPVWDENTYQKRLKKSKVPMQAVTIPILLADGDFGAIQTLFDLYFSEGYNLKVVSDIDKAYLYGIDYVTNDVDIDAYFAQVEHKFRCDMILFWSHNVWTCKSIDLSIELPAGIAQVQIRLIYEFINHQLLSC